jgi:hypothetical protein
MKKLLVSLLVSTMILLGCAGLKAVETSNVCDDTKYFVTSPAGKTSEFCPDEEYTLVTNVREENKEAGVTVSMMWIDYANSAVALQYSVKGEEPMCAIFFFEEGDMQTAVSENYRDVSPYQAMPVNCEELVAQAVSQTNRDKE